MIIFIDHNSKPLHWVLEKNIPNFNYNQVITFLGFRRKRLRLYSFISKLVFITILNQKQYSQFTAHLFQIIHLIHTTVQRIYCKHRTVLILSSINAHPPVPIGQLKGHQPGATLHTLEHPREVGQ